MLDQYIPSITLSVFVIMFSLIIVILVLALIMKKSFGNQMKKYIKQLEDAIKEGRNPSRIIMEDKKISRHFDLLLILFIQEYNAIKRSGLSIDLSVQTINDLVQAWVDSRTGTLTLKNTDLTRQLTKLVEIEFKYIVDNDKLTSRFICGDDHAFDFEGRDGKIIYLSNNDFLRDVLKAFRNFDSGHKAFFN